MSNHAKKNAVEMLIKYLLDLNNLFVSDQNFWLRELVLFTMNAYIIYYIFQLLVNNVIFVLKMRSLKMRVSYISVICYLWALRAELQPRGITIVRLSLIVTIGTHALWRAAMCDDPNFLTDNQLRLLQIDCFSKYSVLYIWILKCCLDSTLNNAKQTFNELFGDSD